MAVTEFVNGLQHIGVPTNDIAKTIEFYTDIGFEKVYETVNNGEMVAFLRLAGVTIETYQNGQAVGTHGAIDHVALDVSDIDAVFARIKAQGHQLVESEVQSLPFWENGVKYFNILGPNGEKIEFSQML